MNKMNNTILNDNIFNNDIQNIDGNIYHDKMQKTITEYIEIVACYISNNKQLNNLTDYSNYISDFKLKKIGEKQSTNSKAKNPKPIAVYFVDTIMKDKKYKKDDKNKPEGEPKSTGVKDNVEFEVFTVEAKKTKFLTVKKNIKSFFTTLLVYFKNEVERVLAQSDESSIENMKSSAYINFIMNAGISEKAKSRYLENFMFEEYNNDMSSKLTNAESGIINFVKLVIANPKLSNNLKDEISRYFVSFVCNLIVKSCITRLNLDCAVTNDVLINNLNDLVFTHADFDFVDLRGSVLRNLKEAERIFKKEKKAKKDEIPLEDTI